MSQNERNRQHRIIDTAELNLRISREQAQWARRMVEQGVRVANPFLPTNI